MIPNLVRQFRVAIADTYHADTAAAANAVCPPSRGRRLLRRPRSARPQTPADTCARYGPVQRLVGIVDNRAIRSEVASVS